METTDQAQQTDEEASIADSVDWYWADPKTLKVNPVFQSLIPLQSKGEHKALEESIKAEGCRDSVLVWKGRNIVLDGHTRRELCIKHKRKVKVREIELEDEKAAVAYILDIQRQRRNLTREAMSYFRGAEYNALKQQHGGARRGRKAKDQTDPLPSTAKLLSEKYGVGEMTINRDGVFAQAIDKIVAAYGDPEVQRKLLGADVRLTHGLARLLLKKSEEERKRIVDQLVAQGDLPRAKNKTAFGHRKPKEEAQSLITRLKVKGEGHARSVLLQMARLLGMEIVAKDSMK